MAKDAQIRARVDADLKEEAEGVLDSLGLSPTSAINMFYRQIVHRRGIPFDVALPQDAAEARPTAKPMAATAAPTRRPSALTYGDFPQLFWSADPKAPLNLDDSTTFARFLTRGDPETVFRVVTLDEIARRLPDLPLQPDRRAFWERVVRAGASG
jgi:addiction module RelB/DinJ family antitoxin